MAKKTLRRKPTQERSIERVEKIMKTARDLIGKHGNDAVSIRQIAAKAKMPISSLYQYFPDKSTLVLTIMERYYVSIRESMVEALSAVRDLDSLYEAVPELIGLYVQFFKENPALANIWAGAQADPKLVKLDNQDTYEVAELFTGVVVRSIPGVDAEAVKAFTLFITHTMGALIRFSLMVDKEDAKMVMDEAETLVKLRIADLASKAQ